MPPAAALAPKCPDIRRDWPKPVKKFLLLKWAGAKLIIKGFNFLLVLAQFAPQIVRRGLAL